jgi:anti-sigma factor RsiW
MSRDHSEYEENVAAYLLGALTELETTAFERHLAGCAGCREEVERLRLAADALPRSVTPLEPPPSLKASLMATVREEAAVADAVPERAGRRAAPRFLRRLVPRLSLESPATAWVAAALLLGALTGYAVSALTADDGRTIAAKVATDEVPFASASLVVPEGEDQGAILRVHGLPSLESNRVYQVWLRRDGEVISQSLFNVGEDGNGSAAVSDPLGDADAVLVTREPRGGARAPGEEPIVTVDL